MYVLILSTKIMVNSTWEIPGVAKLSARKFLLFRRPAEHNRFTVLAELFEPGDIRIYLIIDMVQAR